MNNFFSNNIVWKMASLVSALLLWVFVINTQNPMQSYDVKNRSISLKGTEVLEEKGYVIKNETEIKDQKIRVVVKGPRTQIDKIRNNPDLIEIKVDITKYVNNISANMDMVAPVVPIDISVPIGLTVVEQSPQNLEVIFEREKSVSKTIKYIISGETDQEYETLTPKIVPEKIEIWGAESYMDEIDEVRVDIDVENFSEDTLTYEIPIKIYDAEGQELTELRKSHNNAEVTLPIGKKKTVPLEMQFVGELPEGFIQTSVGLHPKSITIIGKPTLVDKITSIKLGEVSLENIIATSKIETKFILPAGISYLDNIEDSATITIQVKEQSLYNYGLDLSKANVNIINKKDNFNYEIISDEITVKVKSIAENLLNVNVRDVEAIVDMQGYSQGEYEVPITLKFPPEVVLVEAPKITVKITKEEVEEVQEQNPSLPVNPDPNPDPGGEADLGPDLEADIEPDTGQGASEESDVELETEAEPESDTIID